MVTIGAYSPARLRRSPRARRFAIAYVAMVACMLLLGLIEAIVGFSEGLLIDFTLGLLVVFGVIAMPIVMLGPQLRSNRDEPYARPPAMRIPLARCARLIIDLLTLGVCAIAIVQGPVWVLALVIPLLIALAITSWRNDARAVEDLAAHILHRRPGR